MRGEEWGKVLVAIVTPMTAQGKINYSVAASLAKELIAKGCDGIVACGTTGEAATLTVEEKLALFACIREEIKDTGLLIAGVGSNCTRSTVSLIRRVENLSVDGYMVVTPYYNRPNTAGLIEHYRAVAAAATRSIMLYNVPSRTGMNLSLPVYEQILSSCPQVTAIKDAGGDVGIAAQLCAHYPNVAWFSGNDNLILPLVALGFQGVVSVAANVAPKEIVMLTALTREGRLLEARIVNNQLLPLITALFIETNPVPVKAALEMQGYQVGSPRLPLAKLSKEHAVDLETIIQTFTGEGS